MGSFKSFQRNTIERLVLDNEIRIRGNEVPGWTHYSMRGQSETIATAAFQSMAEWPDLVWPTAPFRLAIASESVNDNGLVAGTGLRVVSVRGLDVNFEARNEVLVLNGQTPVISAFDDWYRVNEIVGIRAGSLQYNEGRVTVGDAADTWTAGVPNNEKYAVIGPMWSTAANGMYTVPAGHKAYLIQLQGSIDTPRELDVILNVRRTEFPIFRFTQAWGISGVQIADTIRTGEFLSPGTDIWFAVRKSAGAGADGRCWFALNMLLQDE